MKERLRARFLRLRFNFFPCFRRTGARITSISADLRQVEISLPLNWKTKGYFGVTFGGSIYGASDPILMVMYNVLLEGEAKVWDKRAEIDFLRPGTSKLTARFSISDEDLTEVRRRLAEDRKFDRRHVIEWRDEKGRVCAQVAKDLHFIAR